MNQKYPMTMSALKKSQLKMSLARSRAKSKRSSPAKSRTPPKMSSPTRSFAKGHPHQLLPQKPHFGRSHVVDLQQLAVAGTPDAEVRCKFSHVRV
jgi:hypothetical protein